jgi:hypothetical protein
VVITRVDEANELVASFRDPPRLGSQLTRKPLGDNTAVDTNHTPARR